MVGLPKCRRDDLESLLYICLILTEPNLSWLDYEIELPLQFESILKAKSELPADEFCQGKGAKFAPILELIRQIHDNEEPNYEKIQFMFKTILLEQDMVPNCCHFDWVRAKPKFETPSVDNSMVISRAHSDFDEHEEYFDLNQTILTNDVNN